METKYVKVPFEVELAKKITNGEVEGRIIDNDGEPSFSVGRERLLELGAEGCGSV